MNRSLFLAYLVGFSIAKAQIPICDGHPGNPHAAGLLSGSDSLASCSHQANNQGGFTTNITIDANTIITWESLVNSAQDSLNFFQEDGTGSVLNVVEGTRSVLLGGTIYADGAVGFLAPNLGIGSVLEVDGEISAAELTIATHDLDAPSRANWFSGGSLLFENTAQFDQAINTSGGPIEARDGSLLLVAEDIFNGASLTALNGSVLLAAGQQVKVARDANFTTDIEFFSRVGIKVE